MMNSNDIAKQGQNVVDKTADRAQTFVGQGIDDAKAAAQRIYDATWEASEALVTYTKENPLKAILIAAASGALLVTLASALSRSRD